MAASSDTVLEVFSGLGAGLGFGVLDALLGYSRLPNIILPTRTLVAPTSIYSRWIDRVGGGASVEVSSHQVTKAHIYPTKIIIIKLTGKDMMGIINELHCVSCKTKVQQFLSKYKYFKILPVTEL